MLSSVVCVNWFPCAVHLLLVIYVLQNNDGFSTDREKTMGGGLGGVPPPSKDIITVYWRQYIVAFTDSKVCHYCLRMSVLQICYYWKWYYHFSTTIEWLAEDLFHCLCCGKSVARRAFPPFFELMAPNNRYQLKLFVWRTYHHRPGEAPLGLLGNNYYPRKSTSKGDFCAREVPVTTPFFQSRSQSGFAHGDGPRLAYK